MHFHNISVLRTNFTHGIKLNNNLYLNNNITWKTQTLSKERP